MILVTGASRGIGQYLLGRFLNENIDGVVLGTYWQTPPSEPTPHLVQLDLTQEDQIQRFVDDHLGYLKKIQVINCAGTNFDAMVHKFDTQEWDRVFEVNSKAAFLLAKHLLPIMRTENFGRIIFVSSVVPQLGVAGTAAYASSKASLWGLTKAIAAENATKGITCNCLNLGYFDAGMIDRVPPDLLRQIIDRIPMKRLGNPKDIYEAVRFLFNCSYMTGATLDINGGLV